MLAGCIEYVIIKLPSKVGVSIKGEGQPFCPISELAGLVLVPMVVRPVEFDENLSPVAQFLPLCRGLSMPSLLDWPVFVAVSVTGGRVLESALNFATNGDNL